MYDSRGLVDRGEAQAAVSAGVKLVENMSDGTEDVDSALTLTKEQQRQKVGDLKRYFQLKEVKAQLEKLKFWLG